MLTLGLSASADASARSRADLEYGTVLFEYHQGNYFEGLVEHAYTAASGNPRAQQARAKLLKGSMALSYRMPDVANEIFEELLAAEKDEEIRNRAWYHLARLYHTRSQPEAAYEALENIRGDVPPDLHLDYHYLATLVNSDGEHLRDVEEAISSLPGGSARHPYLLYNLGVSYLAGGNQERATANLTSVVQTANASEERRVLADRARHGLARIAMQNQQLGEAWIHLRDIRTEGLYSNRALLAYAWTALRQELHQTALPALHLLNERSIALAEVQQSKVLIGHVYEQEGSMTRALRSHLQAEQDLLAGLREIEDAQAIVAQSGLPSEFVADLGIVGDVTNWTGGVPSANYRQLAPFLVDLMASNPFHLVLTQLEELYAIRENLRYWSQQTDQHDIILKNAAEKIFDDRMQQAINDSTELERRLATERRELGLISLTLEPREQKRFNALFENTSRELDLLEDTLQTLKNRSAPYKQPASYPRMVDEHHQRIIERQRETEAYIAELEPVLRKLVNAELNKHEERMRYYLAQARLAKARLYDTALMNADGPGREAAPNTGVTK